MRSRVTLFPSLLCLGCVVETALGAIRITECPPDATDPTYSWHNDGEELYIEGEGSCVTPSVIYRNLEDAPLVPMTAEGEEVAEETGIWLLTKSLIMRTGTTLLLHEDLGCEELRLTSSSSSFIELTAAGAYMSLLGTKVFAWSRSGATFDLGSDDGTEPRSYMRVLSERIHSSDDCDGAANEDVGEGRLDIINSEVGYLGYQSAEAYGITYKVHGYCDDESNPEVFDRVNVRGDIRFSNIHHNWFGMYSYGHQDGLWEYNMMHDCGYYGFDPHDDSDNLRIHNNIVYKNGNHGIIASKRCNDVSIQNNVVYDNKEHGIMLHRSSDDGIIRNNTVTNNGNVCIALFESFGIEVSDNICDGNAEGIRLSMGASYNKIFDNMVLNTESRALWLYLGGDEIIASKATKGRCTGNLFENNHIEGSDYGVYFSETRDNNVIANTFTGIVENIWQDSDGVLWKDNVVDGDVELKATDTCVDPDSDLDQIDATGVDVKECS